MERPESQISGYQSSSNFGYEVQKQFSYNNYKNSGRDVQKNHTFGGRGKGYQKNKNDYSDMNKMPQNDNQSITGAISVFSGDQVSESK